MAKNNLPSLAEDIFDAEITFEKTIPLIGFESGPQLDNILSELKEQGIFEIFKFNVEREIKTGDELEQLLIDYEKMGLLSEISIREYKHTALNRATGSITSRIYYVYGEDYEDLAKKALEKEKEQRKEELLKYIKKELREREIEENIEDKALTISNIIKQDGNWKLSFDEILSITEEE